MFNEDYYINKVTTEKLNADQLKYYRDMARRERWAGLLEVIEGATKPKRTGTSSGRVAPSQEVIKLGDYYVKKDAAKDLQWETEEDIPEERKWLYDQLKQYAIAGRIKILKGDGISLKSRKYGRSIVVYFNKHGFYFHNWKLANLSGGYREEWAAQDIDGELRSSPGPSGELYAYVLLDTLTKVKQLLSD